MNVRFGLVSLFKITNRFETYRVVKSRTAFLAANPIEVTKSRTQERFQI
jgi:hypothetical protein